MQGYRWGVLLLLWVPLAFGQGIYKWVDEKGQVHYGEEAPEGAQSAPVTVRNDAPSGGAPVPQDRQENTQKLLRTFQEERTQKEEAATKAADEKAKRKRDCDIARDQLRGLREAGAIYNLDKNGERHIYNDAEHAAALKRADAEVAKYCK